MDLGCRMAVDALEHIDQIIVREAASRGLSEPLVHDYLTRRIVFELGSCEYQGMRRLLEYANLNITGIP